MANQLSDVLTYARKLAKTDSNGLTDADGILHGNNVQRELHEQAIARRADLFNQESYRDITSTEIAGGASPGKFLQPADCWMNKSLEINLQDPTNQSLFVEPTPFDSANLPDGVSLDLLRSQQDMSSPMIEWHGNWFEIVPTPIVALSKALKQNYFIGPTDFAATTDFVQYPYNINIYILSYLIAATYRRIQNKDDSLADKYEDKVYNEKTGLLTKLISFLQSGGQQSQPASQGLQLTGREF